MTYRHYEFLDFNFNIVTENYKAKTLQIFSKLAVKVTGICKLKINIQINGK